ncbi:hypothetical protein N836_33370 [Leptolyngbya sp. Heron Island J]|uniref:hypothetical protein n=1 Tax=Leptolyngbya sp. Heron Island J TaxID=1385935 RepID=UPI0003B9E17C|nr:hypothetical protein [Leptolyngbya sp. Heron Island J]ESA38322.1 hypothetical protein N836_33370 [Leptolyngbya sp. Heron Island J]
MGFAVRADQGKSDSVKSSRKQNLVLLRSKGQQDVSPEALFEAPVRSVPSRAKTLQAVPAEVKQLPRTPRLPLGLKLLVGVQQSSTVLTGGLVATALIIYSWTVYLDKAVARSFNRLDTLKAAIQQVTTANATLKNTMAEQAESPTAGFKPFEPKRAIFLSPAPARPSVEPGLEPDAPEPMPHHPLGY